MQLKVLQNYSGRKDDYALIGMHRDVNRGASDRIVRPFAMTHSIYSFFLLNVEVWSPCTRTSARPHARTPRTPRTTELPW